MDLDSVDHLGSGRSPNGDPCGLIMDQVRPGNKNIQSTGSVDQIHPEHLDLPKIIS